MYPVLQGLPHGDLDLDDGIPSVELLKRGWRLFFSDGNIFLGFLFYILTTMGAGMVPLVGTLLVSGPLLLGLNHYYLCYVRGERPQPTSVFDGFKLFGLTLGAYLLFKLIVFGGFFLCIVGSVIFAIWYIFLWYAIADGERQVWASFVKSRELARDFGWQILLFSIVCGLFNLLGGLACLVGIFITLPITMLATAMLYDLLCAHKGHGLRDPEYAKRYWEGVQRRTSTPAVPGPAIPEVGPIPAAERIVAPPMVGPDVTPPISPRVEPASPEIPPPVEIPPSPEVYGAPPEKKDE
jgi:hypothetical protein